MFQKQFWPTLRAVSALGVVLAAGAMLSQSAQAAEPAQVSQWGTHWPSVPDAQIGDAPFWWAQIDFTKPNGVPWDESDFATIAKYGINGVEINMLWADLEPQKDHYDFQLLDRYMADAAKANLKIYLLFWESAWQEKQGKNPAPWISARDITSDGFTAIEPPWWDQDARKAYFDYMAHTIDHVKTSPGFGGVYAAYGSLDSEWGMPPKGSHGITGYAPVDIQEFHRWLPRTYKTLANFNRQWHTSFKKWADVPAAKPGDSLFPIYQRFRLYSVEEGFDAISRLVRQHTSAPMLYSWGGEIYGPMGPAVQGNDPDIFFQTAKKYHAIVNLDDANMSGLALVFGSMARAYHVPLLEEWTPGHDRMSRTPQWLGHIGLAAPVAVGEDFFIYPPRPGDEGFAHGWKTYTDWHATLAKIIHGYTPEEPVAVIIPTRKIALNYDLDAFPQLTIKLGDFWRHNHVLPHFVTDEQIKTGVVNLQQFRAVVDLGNEVSTLPALKKYATNHPILKTLDESLPYLHPYASADPVADSLEIVPTVDGSSVWLTLANTDAQNAYSGVIRFDPAAVGLSSATYSLKNARTGKILPVTRNADGSVQWQTQVPAAELRIFRINLSRPTARLDARPNRRKTP